MKMSKLSNQTNSQDPQAVNSRLFVGNLNTFQCSKTDVERMFQKYGRLAGISMHKGYAFVQFTNPFDARNACHGEDGRSILSQILDVNMVAEPKPHQTGRKRQNLSKTGNDWDYYYDSYYNSQLYTPPRPIKRQRLMGSQSRSSPIPTKIIATNAITQQQQTQQQQQLQSQSPHHLQHQLLLQQQQHSPPPQQQHIILSTHSPIHQQHPLNGTQINNGCVMVNGTTGDHSIQQSATANIGIGQHLLGPFKVYSNPDTLICGNCRECFTELSELLDHKKSYCKLRFICKCQSTSTSSLSSNSINENGSITSSSIANNNQTSPTLLCVVCKEAYKNPWDLMVHAQAAHMINIYELGGAEGMIGGTATNGNENRGSSPSADGQHKDDRTIATVEGGSDINGLNGDDGTHSVDINGVSELNDHDMKDDASSIQDSSLKDDNSVTSNVHSSNENLFEDQLSSSSVTPPPPTSSSSTSSVSLTDNDLTKQQRQQQTTENGDVYAPAPIVNVNTTASSSINNNNTIKCTRSAATHACIMRTLSIDATPVTQSNVSSLSIVKNAMGIAITHGPYVQQ